MKPKSQPMRTCVGCGEPKAKRELIRVALSPDGNITIDRSGKAPGRGAYYVSLCRVLSRLIRQND